MTKAVFCLLLFLSFFGFLACANPPPPVQVEDSSPPPPTSATDAPSPPTQAEVPPPPLPPPSSPPSRATDIILAGAETYTVVKGDTLSKISRGKYQNGFYYPLIMMASADVVSDQDVLEPGMVLTVPNLRANLNDARAKQSMKKYFLDIADITARRRPADAEGLRNLAGSL